MKKATERQVERLLRGAADFEPETPMPETSISRALDRPRSLRLLRPMATGLAAATTFGVFLAIRQRERPTPTMALPIARSFPVGALAAPAPDRDSAPLHTASFGPTEEDPTALVSVAPTSIPATGSRVGTSLQFRKRHNNLRYFGRPRRDPGSFRFAGAEPSSRPQPPGPRPVGVRADEPWIAPAALADPSRDGKMIRIIPGAVSLEDNDVIVTEPSE